MLVILRLFDTVFLEILGYQNKVTRVPYMEKKIGRSKKLIEMFVKTFVLNKDCDIFIETRSNPEVEPKYGLHTAAHPISNRAQLPVMVFH